MKIMRCKHRNRTKIRLLIALTLLLCFGNSSFLHGYFKKSPKTIHIELFLEGFFDYDSSGMRSAHDFEEGVPKPVYDEGITDEITVSLHKVVNYETYNWGEKLVFQEKTPLTNDGNAWVILPNKINGEPILGNYWLSITHRNHLETVYHNPITIDDKDSYHCSFIHGNAHENNALGDNQAYLGEIFRNKETIHGWAIYAGDINNDGIINFLDRDILRLSMGNGIRGYVKEDLNGDGVVSISDRSILKRNILAGIRAELPSHPNKGKIPLRGF